MNTDSPRKPTRRRWLIIGLAILLFFGVGSGIVLWRLDLIMPYAKPHIETLLSGALRTPVTIGELVPQLFPRAHILARKIETGDDVLRIAELQIDIPLSSLLRGEIELSSIVLVRPVLLLGKLQGKEPSSAVTDDVSREQSNTWLSPQLGRLVVRDGRINSAAGSVQHINAEARITLDGALVRIEDLSGEFEAPLVGPAKIRTPSLRYDRSLHTLRGEPLQIRVLGSDSTLRYSWDAEGSKGEFRFASSRFDSEPIIRFLTSLPLAELRRLKELGIAGKMAPDIGLTLAANDWQLKGDIMVSDGRFKERGFPVMALNGEVSLLGSKAGWEISSKRLSAHIGPEEEAVQLSGRITLPKLGGELRLKGERVSFENLAPLLKSAIPEGIRVQRLQGGADAKVTLGQLIRYEVSLSGLTGEGVYRGIPLRVLRGGVSLGFQAGKGTVTFTDTGFELGADRESVQLAGSLDFPERRGALRVRGEHLSLPGLLALSDSKSEALRDATGTVGLEADIELKGATISARGKGHMSAVSLPHGNPPLRDGRAQYEFRPIDGGTRVELTAFEGDIRSEHVSGRASFDILANEVLISKVDAALLDGTLSGQGALETAGDRRFRFDLKGANFDSARLARMFMHDEKAALVGRISKLNGTLRGRTVGPIAQTLQGNLDFLLQNGVLKGIHLGRVALQKLDRLPIFSGSLYEQMSPELRAYFQGDDTPIRELGATLDIASGVVRTRNARLISNDFAVDGVGEYDVRGAVDFDSRIIFSPEFSRALQAQMYEAKRLMTREGLLVVPLSIKGEPHALQVKPDVRALLEQAAGSIIEKKAQDLLGKFLGGGKPQGATQ